MGFGMIFSDFSKSLGQIADAKFRSVLLRAVGLTFLLLVVFVAGSGWFLGWIIPDQVDLPLIGRVAWLDTLGSGLGVGAGILLSIFLMIPVASMFVGFFLDEIASAVEARHYPDLPEVRRAGVIDMLVDSLRFFGLFAVVNLIALVVYIVFAPVAPLIFWAVNGFLLGREYFQLVALRRLDLKDANALRRRHFFSIWGAGVLMAVPLSVPILSLVVPILGVATFTHQYHRLTVRA